MLQVLVVPTYNERENIRMLVTSVRERYPEMPVFVVDDNSPDGTAEVVAVLQSDLRNLTLVAGGERQGIGVAYQRTLPLVLEKYSPEWIITMDADLSHRPQDIVQLMAAMPSSDLVVGSRYVHGGSARGFSFLRRALSRVGNAYARFITGLPLSDITSGFVAYRSTVLRQVLKNPLWSCGFSFQIDIKHRAWKLGARITEVPITFGRRARGVSKLSGRIIMEGLIAPWRLRLLRR